MEIHLSSAQEAHLAALAAASGRNLDDVVQEALAAWAERTTDMAELRASLDRAEAGLTRGEGMDITPASMQTLATDICQQGRARHHVEDR